MQPSFSPGTSLRSPGNAAPCAKVCGSLSDAAGRPALRLSRSLAGALVSILLVINPAAAQDPEGASTETADLGVMDVNLEDAVKFDYGFRGALQGAGTPNQAGIGAFLPLHIGNNSVTFVDAEVNANFGDYSGYSSIVNTDVSGTTFATSTRLGYRWLNGNRSWMFGINTGYDSRPMKTGGVDTNVAVTDPKTVFFQQVAAGLEAVSDTWNVNAYALVPVGENEKRLNSGYLGGALTTAGLDIGYRIKPELLASIGYYHQHGDLDEADGSGARFRLAYNLTDELTVGTNLSHDQAFDTRVSADISFRFGAGGYGTPSAARERKSSLIQALTAPLRNRDVRVHDDMCKQADGTFTECQVFYDTFVPFDSSF